MTVAREELMEKVVALARRHPLPPPAGGGLGRGAFVSTTAVAVREWP